MNSEDDIRKLLNKHERRIRRLFDLAMAEYRGSLNLSVLEDFILRGDILGALGQIEAVAIATANAAQAAFIEAATATSAFIQSRNVVTVGFDAQNTRAVAAIRQNRLNFIQQFTEQQRRATRAALTAGIADGLGPREQARAFRASIGLTERQQLAVQNYRKLLQRIGADDVPSRAKREVLSRKLRDRRFDRTVQRALRGDKTLTPVEIENMVERYRQRSINHRAVTIARTEALHSVHAGQNNAIDEAILSGAVIEDDLVYEWLTGQDGRQRDPHQELHKTQRGHNEPWENSLGTIFYPGDRSAVAANVINCRCIRTLRVK